MERRELPEGWRWVRLEGVTLSTDQRDPRREPKSQFLYVDITSIDSGSGVIIGPRPVVGSDAPSRARKVIREGDVLFATTRPYLRSIALVPPDLDDQVCSTGFCVLRADSHAVMPQWLYYCAKSDIVLDQVLAAMRGAAYPAVTDKDVRLATIPLPPLEEQRSIVARIEALAERIERAKGLRREALAEAEALLPAALAQTIGAARGASATRPLGELARFTGGGTPSRQEPSYWGGTVPWVSPKDMKIWEIADSEERITEEAVSRSAVKWVEPGAVLVVVRGMILAKMLPVAIGRARLTVNQDMKALAPLDGLTAEFLAYALKGSEQDLLPQVEIAAHGTRRLRTEILAALPVPMPPLAEQRRIVAYLDNVRAQADALRRLQSETQAELEALLPSVLERAFRGEL